MIYTNTIYIKYSILLCIIIIFCIHLCKNNLNELHHRRTVKSELMKNPIIDYFSSLDHSQRAQGCGDQCPKPAPLARDPEATNLLNDLVAAPTEPLFSCLT